MRYCLALDLKPDPTLIAEYDEWHTKVWPEVEKSILDSGITTAEIYRAENRLFMILETAPDFTLERKGAMDAANEAVQRWEEMMWKYQVALPGNAPGAKWRLMEKVYSLSQSK